MLQSINIKNDIYQSTNKKTFKIYHKVNCKSEYVIISSSEADSYNAVDFVLVKLQRRS